jgi:hypothetical protein
MTKHAARAATAALATLALATPAAVASPIAAGSARGCPAGPAPPPDARPASAARIDAYVQAVAAASPVVRTAVAGRSVAGRPLRYAVVSALPSTALHAGLARLRAVRAGRARTAGRAPAVVWVAGSVHGNEPAGADADLRLLHELASRCRDPLLRDVAIVVMPVQNPDGHEAGTRTNANGFDLNRDWLTVTQPETEARLSALLAMPPLVLADQHEQGGNAFFFPPYAPPLFHEVPDTALAAERAVLGPALRRAFAHRRVAATSGEGFDLLYPGYSDSASTLLFGAAGMTLEAGADQPYPRRVREHLLAARTVIEAVARHRTSLLRAWTRSFATAARQGARGELQHRPATKVYGYALGAEAEPLVRRLMGEGVRVEQLAAPVRVAAFRPYAAGSGGARGAAASARGAVAPARGAAAVAAAAAPATLPAGTYLVPSAQPLKHWIEALLGPNPMAGRVSGSDIGAWSRPLLLGVAGGSIGSPLPRAPAAPVPAAAATRPLAGRRIALLADARAASAVAPGLDQPNAGTSWARWVLTERLGAQVDVLDDSALAAGGLAGHGALVVADGSKVDLTAPALQAIGAFVFAGGTYVGWRGRGIDVARAAGLTTAIAAPAPGAVSIPGAIVAVGGTAVLDDDDPFVSGGHVLAAYGPVLSGWTSGSPAGHPAILDEHPGAGHAVLFAFDPVFRASTEGAERLVVDAIAGGLPVSAAAPRWSGAAIP